MYHRLLLDSKITRLMTIQFNRNMVLTKKADRRGRKNAAVTQTLTALINWRVPFGSKYRCKYSRDDAKYVFDRQ